MERRVEGAHAFLKRRAAHATRRTEAFDSLTLRLPELKEALQQPGFASEFVALLEQARSPHRLVQCLGMINHPTCKQVCHTWDRLYRKVVYHADMFTLYNQPLPSMDVGPAAGPEPPPLPPPCRAPPTQANPLAGAALQADQSPGQGGPIEQRDSVVPIEAASVPVDKYEYLIRQATLCYFHVQMRAIDKDSDVRGRSFFSGEVPACALDVLVRTFWHGLIARCFFRAAGCR